MVGSRAETAKRVGFTVVALSAVLSLSGCDWTQLAYGPEHTGATPDVTISKGAVQSSSLQLDWTATTSAAVVAPPAIAAGKAYVASKDRRLYAYDATGAVGCAGSPKTCAALWTSVDLGSPLVSSPAVDGGKAYVASSNGRLFAFDAAGTTSCSGTPKVCSPLWTVSLPGAVVAAPTIANGRIYVVSAAGASDALTALDAATGTRVWSATIVNHSPSSAHTTASPTVANGRVYASFNGVADAPPEAARSRVLVFDAAGVSGCSGTPRTCLPLWETDTDADLGSMGTPTVAGAVMFVSGLAFDAGGVAGCSGVPTRCRPMWSLTGEGDVAVANGVAFRGASAFDAAGVTSCSGAPKICQPLWTGAIGNDTPSSASVANGVVYVGTRDELGGGDAKLYTFDATGTTSCAGTPRVCQSLWAAPTGGAGLAAPEAIAAPAVSDGRVYVGALDGTLSTFALEKAPPTTAIVAPLAGDSVAGTTVLAATAADNIGIDRVEFRRTGGGVTDALVGVATPSGPSWILNWNTRALPEGPYTLTSVATDFAGNTTRSAGVPFILHNAPPPTPATVSADSLPTVQVAGIVWAQALVGTTVYATGNFTRARPAGAAAGVNEVTRTHLLAYDITTGQLLPFNHTLNGEGRAITATPDGSRIYVGGSFTTVDGAPHPRLAAFNTANGSLVTSFTGGVNSTVRAVTATNTAVYAGGGFSAASTGASRGRLVAFSSAGGLLSWRPSADSTVAAMVMSPDQERVIFGGSFSTVNGLTYHALAAADAATGVPVPWASQSDTYDIRDDSLDSGITSLTADATQVYVTGFNFNQVFKPGGFEGRAAISPDDGSVYWISDCHGDTYSAAPVGNVLYSVSHAHDCEPAGAFPETNPRTYHRALAETTFATHFNGPPTRGYWSFQGVPAPTQLDWYPDVNTGSFSGASQGGWSVVGNASYVAMGGEFTRINGKPQQALSRFAIRSLAPNKVGPEGYAEPGITASPANALGEVAVSWSATWDRDDGVLTYRLFRDDSATPISTMTADTRFWRVPTMAFTDRGLAPGSAHTYRLVVSDPFGNTVMTTS